MPRKAPPTLFFLVDQFLEEVRPFHIMFCKRCKVEDIWEIGVGAVLDIRKAHPRLIQLCKELYKTDDSWLVGDTDTLMTAARDHQNPR